MQPGTLAGIRLPGWDHLGQAVVTQPDLPSVGGRIVTRLDDPVVVRADQDEIAQQLLICLHAANGAGGRDLLADQQ